MSKNPAKCNVIYHRTYDNRSTFCRETWRFEKGKAPQLVELYTKSILGQVGTFLGDQPWGHFSDRPAKLCKKQETVQTPNVIPELQRKRANTTSLREKPIAFAVNKVPERLTMSIKVRPTREFKTRLRLSKTLLKVATDILGVNCEFLEEEKPAVEWTPPYQQLGRAGETIRKGALVYRKQNGLIYQVK